MTRIKEGYKVDEVVYLVKIILEEMEGKDHGESS